MLRKTLLLVIALISLSYAFGLTAGDIAILGVNADATKSMVFVALEDIPAESTISFTDNAWNATTLAWRTGEGTIAWSNTTLVGKGTVVTLTLGTTYAASVGTVTTNTNFNLSTSGDQVLAYAGTTAPVTNTDSNWLYGFSLENWVWGNSTNTSDIPTALAGASVGLTSSTTEKDNGYFANDSTAQTAVSVSGTKAELLALFTNSSLYYSDDAGPLTFPTYAVNVGGAPVPTIYLSGSLTAFSTYTGTPSASQSYNLSGTNLTANIAVTPPAGFALSTDNSTFSGSLSLAPSFNGLVYVRLTGTAPGTFSGDITHTSGTAAQVDLAATGTVSDPVPTIHVTGTLNAFSAITGTPSASQSYTLSGSFLTANILVTPPAGFEVSTDNTTFTSSVSVANTYNGLIYVRLTGATAGSYSGNITHTSTGATQVDLAASGSVVDPAAPTMFWEENFAYTVGTTVASNGWTAHNGAGTASPLVDAQNLAYAGYIPSLGGSARTTGVTGEDISRGFTQQTSGDIYVAWLMDMTSLPNTTQDYNFHLGDAAVLTGGTNFRGRLYVQRNAENLIRFGVSKGSTSTTIIQFTDYMYAYNTTYLMVMKYKVVEGPANDEVYLWVNPVIGPTEPAHTLYIGTTDTTSDPSNLAVVAIRQSANTPAAYYDGIRVTNDWAMLWSGETPPTPVISVTGTPDYLYSIAGSPTDPGEITSYQLAGDNLVGPITVNAPENFEVSTNGVDGWADTIQVPASYSGSIYVRLYAPTAGEYGGDISHTSAGAEEVLLRVDGEALAPDVVWNLTNNMVPFAGVVGEASDIQSYSLSATNAVAPIDITVMDGPFEFATSPTGPWSTSGSLPSTFSGNIYVRMLTTTAGSFNGSIKHTTTNASELFVYPSGVVDPPAGVYATDLFFSEYIEGSSNNKAVEIFNGTGAPVDLSNYKVELYANGSATPGNTLTFTAGTMLAHNDVYVIANAGANATILAQSDVTSTVTYFNGDDALALKKISTDAYVDIFGVLGNDPDGTANNTGWTADGGYSTMNKTLVRKPTVTQGISVNPPNPGTGISTGFLTLATEWDVYAIDTLDYLGAHTFTPGMEVAAAPVILPAGGIQTGPVNVTMSSTTPGAVIYYTLDGSVPTDSSLNYNVTGSFAVSATTTVKAITYATGYAPSAVTEVEYIYPTLVSTIATLRTMPTGTTNIYRLTTEAILTFQQVSRNQKYIQDATAAIVIDDAAGVITTTYNLYDGITGITGTLGLYSGLLQFTPVVNTAPATSTGNVVVPEVRTLASLTTADQAKLIKVMNVTLDTTLGTFPATAANINATDPTTTLVMRTFPNADYSGTDIPATAVNVTCLVGEFSTTMQISPRFLADFEAAAGQLTSPTVTISYVGGGIQLDWDPIAGATSYRVEHSDDPYTGFTTLDTTTNDYYIFIPAAGTASKFYQVIAVP